MLLRLSQNGPANREGSSIVLRAGDCHGRRVLVFALALLALAGAASSPLSTPVDRAMLAFYQNDYRGARRIASKHPEDPRALLVLAYCDIHDPRSRDWKRGLERLEAVVERTGDEPELQRAVRMSLVNTVDALAEMGQLPNGVEVDVEGICREFLAANPPVAETWESLMMLLWRAARMERGSEQEKRLRELETFVNGHLDRVESAPASKFLGEFYLWHGEHEKAADWLAKSVEHALVNPMMNAATIMMLARVRHRELGDREGAIEAYRMFLEKFPLSARAADARRFLDELEGRRP
jgi:hypothetical protein